MGNVITCMYMHYSLRMVLTNAHPFMWIEIQYLYMMYRGSILVLNPNLAFLVDTEVSRSILDHPAIVVIDSFQDNLFVHATHQTFPTEKNGHPLLGIDLDTLPVLVYVL